MSLRILTRKPKKRNNNKKVKIPCSFYGEEHIEVILNKEIVDLMNKYQEANSVFAYLECKGFLNEEVKTNLTSIITDCDKDFIKYNLSKWFINADYKFNESKVI